MLRRVSSKHESIFDGPKRMKIVESVKKGVPKSQTARRFGVDRATLKRYCKRLDERGTLESGKRPPAQGFEAGREGEEAPFRRPREERPWALPTLRGHSSGSPWRG